MRVPVIDNGGQWTHREYRVLRDLGVESLILPNTTPREDLVADGVVLSGGALSLEGSASPLGVVGSYLEDPTLPVLAICLGHEYLGRHFGGRVGRSTSPEFGRVALTVDRPDHPLFEGIPREIHVWASHNDEVTELPRDFERLAHSPGCAVEAMAHRQRPVFGVQFHPEVEHTEHGVRIFENFLRSCRR